jgi:hypothetical protein
MYVNTPSRQPVIGAAAEHQLTEEQQAVSAATHIKACTAMSSPHIGHLCMHCL